MPAAGTAAAEAPARPAATGAPSEELLEPVYVWDLVVRTSHWLIVFSILTLTFTGIDIARPFLDTGGGKAGFTHGWVRIVHFYAAMVFSLAVGSRILWMFAGPRVSGWRTFLPVSRRRQRGLVQTFLFYIMIKPKPPESIGHNPLAGLTYVAVFGLYLLMILTGFALYSVSAYTSYMKGWDFLLPWFHGPQGARWIHHVVMWLILGFAVHHVFSAMLTSKVEKNGCIDSIVSGYKFLPRDRKPNDDVE